MKIILAGVGDTGSFIAKYLSEEDMDIVVIDAKANVIREITDANSISGIVGDCTSPQVLRDADIKNADMFIAVSTLDEVNIIACQLASMFGVQTKIARIKSPNYLQEDWQEFFRTKKFAVDSVIAPSSDLVSAISLKIEYNYLDIANVMSMVFNEVKAFSITCMADCIAINSNIAAIEEEAKYKGIHLKIFGILRGGSFIIPNKDDFININDKIFISTITNQVEECYWFFYTLNESENKFLDSQTGTLVVYGDNPFIKDLSISLHKEGHKVKVVLPNFNTKDATDFASELKKYNIPCINDDITQSDYRRNYHNNNDIIIIFNKKDEENVLTSLLLKNQGVSNIFCCLNDNYYENFLLNFGIKQIFIPDYFIMSSILLNIRRGIIFNVYSLFNKAEILEIEVASNSIISGKRLKNIEVDGSLAIINVFDENERPLILDSDLIIMSGYRVVYVALKSDIKHAEHIFSHNVEQIV